MNQILSAAKRVGLLEGLNNTRQAERLVAFTLGYRAKSSRGCKIEAAKNAIAKGHAIVKAETARRVDDWTCEEFQDVFFKVREVERIVCADAYNISIKDGEAAGQPIVTFTTRHS